MSWSIFTAFQKDYDTVNPRDPDFQIERLPEGEKGVRWVVFVQEKGDVIAGWALTLLEDEIFKYTIKLSHLFVVPEHWGRGLASGPLVEGMDLLLDNIRREVPISLPVSIDIAPVHAESVLRRFNALKTLRDVTELDQIDPLLTSRGVIFAAGETGIGIQVSRREGLTLKTYLATTHKVDIFDSIVAFTQDKILPTNTNQAGDIIALGPLSLDRLWLILGHFNLTERDFEPLPENRATTYVKVLSA